ncbi:hypothetical protein VTL71DRAFT_11445 [Oculimacula yallundae]|uniref:Uncharacterized protein n=1 Tax=Oculimacula yallundae TaxID=86028 RepID=A0ABR4CQL3_9HELO
MADVGRVAASKRRQVALGRKQRYEETSWGWLGEIATAQCQGWKARSRRDLLSLSLLASHFTFLALSSNAEQHNQPPFNKELLAQPYTLRLQHFASLS